MVNRVILIGNVGKDPEQKDFDNGKSIVSFSLATSEKWKDKNSGERKEKSTWHRVVVQNPALQKIVMQYVKKGSKVYVEGAIDVREWDDKATGEKRRATEIAVKSFDGNITLLDGKKGDNNTPPDDSYAEEA